MSLQPSGPYQTRAPGDAFYLDVDFGSHSKPVTTNFGSLGPQGPNFGPVGPHGPNFGPMGPHSQNFGPFGYQGPNFGHVSPYGPNFGPMGPHGPNFEPGGFHGPNFRPEGFHGPNFEPVDPSNSYNKPIDPPGKLDDHCKPTSAKEIDKGRQENVIQDVLQSVYKKKKKQRDVGKKAKQSEEIEAPLPAELLNMFKRYKCELCMCVLPNSNQADIHYIGKMHFRRMKRYLKLWSEREKKELHPSWMTMIRTHKTVHTAHLPKDENANWCKVCNIYFQSVFESRIHYRGTAHEKRVEVYLKQHPDAYVVTKSSLKKNVCEICNIKTSGLKAMQLHYNGNKHKKNLKLLEQAQAEKKKIEKMLVDLEEKEEDEEEEEEEAENEVNKEVETAAKKVEEAKKEEAAKKVEEAANVLRWKLVKNDDAASADGSAEGQNVDICAEDIVKNLFCKICNVKFASKDDANRHVNSPGHRNEVKWHRKHGASTVEDTVNENIECEICKISFRSKSEYDSHLRWNSHVNKKTMLEKQYIRKHQTCELCRMDFFSEQSYEAHFSTPLHIGNKQWAKDWTAKQSKPLLPVEDKPVDSASAKNSELGEQFECNKTKGETSKSNSDTSLESKNKNLKSQSSSDISGCKSSQLEDETDEANEDKKTFECKLCSISVIGLMAYEHHIGSTKHILRLSLELPEGTTSNALESTSSQQEPTLTVAKNKGTTDSARNSTSSKQKSTLTVAKNKDTSKNFYCELCNNHCETFPQYKSHLESKKHKSVAAKIVNKQLTQRNTNDPKLDENVKKGILKNSAELNGKPEKIDKTTVCVDINKASEKSTKTVVVLDVQSESKHKESSPSNLITEESDEPEDTKVFECKLCGVSVVGSVPFELHVGSMQHTLKLAHEHSSSKEVGAPLTEHNSPLVENTNAQNTYYCEMCNYSSISFNQHESHLKSNKHKSAVAAVEIARAKSKQKPTQPTSGKVIKVSSHMEKNIHEGLQITKIVEENKEKFSETSQNTEVPGRMGRTLAEISRSLRERHEVCPDKEKVSSKPCLPTEVFGGKNNLIEFSQTVKVPREPSDRKTYLPTTYAIETSTSLKNTVKLAKTETSHSTGKNILENLQNAPEKIQSSAGISDVMRRALQRFQTPKAFTETRPDTAVSDAIKKTLERIQTAEIPRQKEKVVPDSLLNILKSHVRGGVEETYTERHKSTDILHTVETALPESISGSLHAAKMEHSEWHQDTTVLRSAGKGCYERGRNTAALHSVGKEQHKRQQDIGVFSSVRKEYCESNRDIAVSYTVENKHHERRQDTRFLGAVENKHPERYRDTEILRSAEEYCDRYSNTALLRAVEREYHEKRNEILRAMKKERSDRQQSTEIPYAAEKTSCKKYQTNEISYDATDISENSEVTEISNDPLKMTVLNTLLKTSMSDKMRLALIEKLKTTEISKLMDETLPERSQNTDISCAKDIRSPKEPQDKEVSCRSQTNEKPHDVISMTVKRSHIEKSVTAEYSRQPDVSSGKKFACKVCQVNHSSSSELIEHTDSEEHETNVELLRKFIAKFRHLASSDHGKDNITEYPSYRCFKCGFSSALVRDFNRHILETHWDSVLAVRKRKYQASLQNSNVIKPSTSYSITDGEMQQSSLAPIKLAKMRYSCTLCKKRYDHEEDYKRHLKGEMHNKELLLYGHRGNSRAASLPDNSSSDRKHSLQDSVVASEVSPPGENQKEQGTKRKLGQVVQSWSRQGQSVQLPSSVQVSQVNPPIQKITSESIEVTVISAHAFNRQSL